MTASLRFVACGGVGDGKSTLIERLARNSGHPLQGQLDAMASERAQGNTFDFTCRAFSTGQRRFVVAETPGDEQYTRRAATSASTAELAVILVDARVGLLAQTRRQSVLASLLGIRHVVLVVNKMDLVAYSPQVFRDIERAYRSFAGRIGLDDVACIPMSALHGDNVVEPSARMPWYEGLTVMQVLESVPVDELRLRQRPLRLSVRRVDLDNPHPDSRGLSGAIATGSVRIGQHIRVQPSGRESRVARVVTARGDVALAVAGQSVMLTFVDEIDVSRGDLLCGAEAPAEVADQFEATVVWMGEQPMLRGRNYLINIGAMTATATVAPLKYKINVDTLEHFAATRLERSEIGVVQLELDRTIAFDAYRDNRDTGGFILIDRISRRAVGAGMLHFALRRSHNVQWQTLHVNKHARAAMKGQTPFVLWFTGLSGAGKSTIANLVEKRLSALGRHTYLLDGDNVRHGLSKDLGFTDADRVENIRRVSEVAGLMVDAGLIVITAFISPFRSERRAARALFESGRFVEVHIDTPLTVAEQRDAKGLYKKARSGALRNFTGIDSPYEVPEHAEIRVDTTALTAPAAAEFIVAALRESGLLN